jgi:hypothetical protein
MPCGRCASLDGKVSGENIDRGAGRRKLPMDGKEHQEEDNDPEEVKNALPHGKLLDEGRNLCGFELLTLSETEKFGSRRAHDERTHRYGNQHQAESDVVVDGSDGHSPHFEDEHDPRHESHHGANSHDLSSARRVLGCNEERLPTEGIRLAEVAQSPGVGADQDGRG